MSPPSDTKSECAGCRHCGSPLTSDTRESGFCCSGCSYVYRLIHERGFDSYYRIKDKVIPPVDPGALQSRDYAWLADLQTQAEAAVAGQEGATGRPPELTLELQGISCVGCVWLVEKVFSDEPGSLRAEINAQSGRIRLLWKSGVFDAVHFARTLQSFNYYLGPAGAEDAPPESRDLVKRIGLCAAFAMNIMLFTLPTYFGMEATFPYARLFGTLSMVLATLSLLSGGSYFIGRALRAIRERMIHIDLPIAVGIIGSYAGSVYGWLVGDERFVYFDFVGTFILLMLIGRWAQIAAVERNRRRLLSRQMRPVNVEAVDDAGVLKRLPVESMREGLLFSIATGHPVPVDARLETEDASFSMAWINGESEPRVLRKGQRVPAGAVNLSRAAIRLVALQSWNDSLLAELLAAGARTGHRHQFFERIIKGYLIAIFVIAAGAGIFWFWHSGDVQRVLSVVTAVLVVSCPCAIGLALPLADELATTAMRRRGVFVRENDLWAKLGAVRTLIFDKTGTLTLETPFLANPGAIDSLVPEDRRVLMALVRDNPHPVSQTLLETLLGQGIHASDAVAERVVETVGQGVELNHAGARWTLGRPGWARDGAPTTHGESAEGNAEVVFSRAGETIATFAFSEQPRAGVRDEIATLRRSGMDVYILSGDRRHKVEAMAGALGLPVTSVVAEATPHGKAQWVKAHDNGDTMMLGDGANDSLAFDAAHCRGTPVVHRGMLEQKADFYYLGRGAGGLLHLFAVDRERRVTQTAILVFSVVYNALAVGLAVAGLMSPLIAAILMPASSLTSLAIVGIGMRRCLRA